MLKRRLRQSRLSAFFLTAALLAMLHAATPASASQTDAALSLYGAFNGSTTGNNVVQRQANAAGAMIELRHLVHPWLGYEATYSFNRANQNYTDIYACNSLSGPGCNFSATASANAQEFTGDWVVSFHALNVRPFALVGVGLLVDVPTGGTAYTGPFFGPGIPTQAPFMTSNSFKPVFVYGAGVDWGLLPHLGLRFQYRGNLSKAAALTNVIQSSNAFTQTAEPMIGAYFRF